jgi:hypothetical protein
LMELCALLPVWHLYGANPQGQQAFIKEQQRQQYCMHAHTQTVIK